jgi:hypothetical protein
MANNSINSFTQTVEDLVNNANIALQTLVSLNESMTTD